jgi:hypothetical protein
MKKLIIMCLTIFALSACTDLTELNVDVKNPSTVPAGTLFANSTVELFDFMASTNVNINNLRLWSQYWTETTYTDEANYDLVTRNSNGRTWNTLYATVIRDVRAAKDFIAANSVLTAADKNAQLAMCEVIEIYAFHVLVDLFGDVPYSAALGDDDTPAYDDDAAIYADLIARLGAAIPNLDGQTTMGASDLIYGGDASQWKKFANSLRLRLAIQIADVNSSLAKTTAEAAIASGVFTSDADDFQISYQSSPPNTNPVWEDLVQSGRDDFVAANTLVDYMNTLTDPRRAAYFDAPYDVNGNPIGGIYGANSPFSSYSHVGAVLHEETLPGVIMDYTEVEFLLADAAARGYAGAGTIEEHYNAGIESSILEWGGSAADVTAYLGQANVAYATAAGADWKQKIALQKWIAMYNRGFEGYNTYRLYDAPTLNVAAAVGLLPPTRYTYPTTEYSLNGPSIEAAATAIGGDLPTTKVFWDAN